jgi:disulfide bond formation protein DsbB
MRRADALLAGSAVASLGGVGVALVSQYRFDILPCPWCVLQRVIFVAVAIACMLGLLLRSRAGHRIGATLALALAACGAAAALWQHFVAAASASCNLSLADRIVSGLGLDALLPSVFMALASCADAAVKLLGVPYELWSLALFVLLGGAALAVLRRP